MVLEESNTFSLSDESILISLNLRGRACLSYGFVCELPHCSLCTLAAMRSDEVPAFPNRSRLSTVT